MAKFNKAGTRTAATQPGTTTGVTTTYEGGQAYIRDNQSELMLLAVNNMVGEDTFYEKAADRDDRFVALVHKCAVEDPDWMLQFITWLRGEANMRSASVVAACEAVKARLDVNAEHPLTGFREFDHHALGHNRRFIDAACLRADEPGEIVSYWTSKWGTPVPGTSKIKVTLPLPVRRGLADAVTRLYNGKSLIKYDSKNAAVRFGDVVQLCHAKPNATIPEDLLDRLPEDRLEGMTKEDVEAYRQAYRRDRIAAQGDLFEYAIDVRRHPRTAVAPESNKTLTAYRNLMMVPAENRRGIIANAEGAHVLLAEAGITWETLAGWLQGPMDKVAWEAIIPNMGAMALVRNLRNFDEQGVSDEVARFVNEQLSNPENIRQSRMFPYRMLQAYGEAPSSRWAWALDKALDASCQNIPALSGKTLVLVDTSGSMTTRVSRKSSIACMEVGALIGVALAAKGNGVDLWGYANGQFHFPLKKGGSVLKQTEAFCKLAGTVGHGTETVAAVSAAFKPGVHKRVVIVTDGQAFHSGGRSVSAVVPEGVPLFGYTLGGYRQTGIDTSKPNRYEIGGFSDAMFRVMGVLAEGKHAGWPWDH
jgi:hypothetical protein